MAGPGHLDPRALEASTGGATGPFHPDHLGALLGANALGAALVFAGWWASSGLGSARSQLAWLNLSIVGLLVAGAANGQWLARGRRSVNLARVAVLPYPPSVRAAVPAAVRTNGNGNGNAQADLGALAGSRQASVSVGAGRSTATADARDGFVAASNMSRYHRPGCLLVAGKQVRMAVRAEHDSAGRAPCEVCMP